MVAWVLFIGTTASRRSLVFSRSCAKCNAAVKETARCKQHVYAKREADEERERLTSDRNDLKRRLTKAEQELVDTKEQCITLCLYSSFQHDVNFSRYSSKKQMKEKE